MQVPEHFRVARAAAAGKRHLAAQQVHLAPRCIAHHDALHRARFVLYQFLRIGTDQELDRSLPGQVEELREQDLHLQNRDPALFGPLIAPREIRFVPARSYGMTLEGPETVLAQPVERSGGLVDEDGNEFGVDLPLADAHDVFEVRFRRILDFQFRLKPGAGGRDLAHGAVQRAPEPMGAVHDQHPRSLPGGENGAGQSGRTASDHDQVPGFAGRTADSRHQGQRRRRARPGEQFPLVDLHFPGVRQEFERSVAHL